jgi:lysine-specific histone demethylase 1B
MKRRDFIYKTILAGSATAIVPAFLLSCKKTSPLSPKFSGNVVVVGAGASGLYAAKTLKDAGIRVDVLEAAPVVGGRFKKTDAFADFPIDLGAQWLHGKNTFLKKIADQNHVEMYIDWAEWVHKWFGGEFVESFPEDFSRFQEAAWGDYTVLPDITFLEYAKQQNYPEDIFPLLELMASTSGSSADRISIREYAKEIDKWTFGEDAYWFQQSLYDFMDNLLIQPLKDSIHLNTIVKKIDYSGDKIIVTDQNGNSISADRVIVTVPVPVLKDGDIEFVPALPAERINAIKRIGMDQGAKLFLKFNDRFYEGCIQNGDLGTKYVDAAYGKESNDNILLTSYFGSKADYFNTLGESAIIDELLQELDLLFDGKASTSFEDAIIQNWGKEPFIRGAYSYQTVGIGDAREIAAKDIEGKIFFSGEALSTSGSYQIIDGAAETGYQQAVKIING